MIRWGEEKRNKDTGFFCNLITKEEGSDKKVWIISDARRHSDIDFFKKKYEKETITIRIHSDLNVRVDRGFIFKKGKFNSIEDIHKYNLLLISNFFLINFTHFIFVY